MKIILLYFLTLISFISLHCTIGSSSIGYENTINTTTSITLSGCLIRAIQSSIEYNIFVQSNDSTLEDLLDNEFYGYYIDKPDNIFSSKRVVYDSVRNKYIPSVYRAKIHNTVDLQSFYSKQDTFTSGEYIYHYKFYKDKEFECIVRSGPNNFVNKDSLFRPVYLLHRRDTTYYLFFEPHDTILLVK